MGEKHTLVAKKRDVKGKKVHRLRKEGTSIASISTPDGTSLSLQLSTKDFTRFLSEGGETGLLYLQIEGESGDRPALIEELQVGPVSGDVLHVMFKQVNLKEKIVAEVPVEIVGEFKVAGGVMVTVKDSVEVEALPTDLPEKFVIDVSTLTQAGDSITLADLKFDASKVALVLGEDQTAEGVALVIAQEMREEAEEAPVEAVPAEGAPVEPVAEETKAE